MSRAFDEGRAERRRPDVSTAGSAVPVHCEDRALGQRDDVEPPVGTGLDIRADTEVAPEEQALALGDLPLVEVVGDAVLEARVVDGHAGAVVAELDAEEVAALEQ